MPSPRSCLPNPQHHTNHFLTSPGFSSQTLSRSRHGVTRQLLVASRTLSLTNDSHFQSSSPSSICTCHLVPFLLSVMAAHAKRPYAPPLSDDELFLPVLYHLTMPPCIPYKEAGNLDRIGSILIGRLRDAARTFSEHTKSPSRDVWAGVYNSLNACRNLNQDGRLTMVSLLPAFRDLDHGILLILHVAAQNAAITIRRTEG